MAGKGQCQYILCRSNRGGSRGDKVWSRGFFEIALSIYMCVSLIW